MSVARTAVVLSMLGVAGCELLGVVVVGRHGDRELLVKDFFEEKTEGTLTQKGYERMKWVGEVLSGYTTPLNFDNLSIEDLHERVRVRSSYYDRTVATGNAVMEGMFKGTRRPVVFSQPDTDDASLRFYGKCTAFQAQVLSHRVNSVWGDKERSTEAERTTVAAHLNTSSTMDDIWNMHDMLLLMNQTGQDTAFVNANLQFTTDLSNWIADYDYSVASYVHTAGYLLHQINTFIQTVSEKNPKRFEYWSGHFPTIKSLAVLLGIHLPGVPGFGSTFIIEVERNTVSREVSIVIKYMDLGSAWTQGSKKEVQTLETVKYEAFKKDIKNKEKTLEEWCAMCVVPPEVIPMCAHHVLNCSDTKVFVPSPVEPEEVTKSSEIAIAVVLGILIGVICTMATLRYTKAKHNIESAARREALREQYQAGRENPPPAVSVEGNVNPLEHIEPQVQENV